MKYNINYGCGASAIPDKVSEMLLRANADDLRLLIYMCTLHGDFNIADASKYLSCTDESIASSLAFWRGTGIIAEAEDIKKDKKIKKTDKLQTDMDLTNETEHEKPKEKTNMSEQMGKKVVRDDALPNYTSDELSGILEQRKDVGLLINECQNIFGKVFNVHEVNIIIGLLDYLSLESEYILILLKYCVEAGKKTLHYVEKTAFSLYDSGICEVEALSLELRRRESAANAEIKIRKLFGVGERALTAREKKEINAWINDFGFDLDIIKKAYEVTVDATGKGTMHYANSVLERWHTDGYKTLEQINASYEEKNKEKITTESGSFDTDEFFEAAVRRSLGTEV